MARPDNIQLLCRLCLVKDQVDVPIFDEQGDRQIFLKITSCLPLSISREDNLPKKICDGCSNKLDTLYEFNTTCIDAEKTLQSWLDPSYKDPEETITAPPLDKPPEVKIEAIETFEIEDDDEVEEPTKEDDEPPPKRARRSAAVKAQMTFADDDDSEEEEGEEGEEGEELEDDDDEDDNFDTTEPKMEDDSDESEGEVKNVPLVVPGTSTEDQPGPSGLGKDGEEAP